MRDHHFSAAVPAGRSPVEIIARSDDVAAVLRCAAASKLLRGAILDPGFRRRLALRAAANGGFDPALLVAVSYRLGTAVRRDTAAATVTNDVVVQVQPSWGFRFDASLLRWPFQLASARDGLLVLWRNQEPSKSSRVFPVEQIRAEIRVCNTFTGHVAHLPYTDLGHGRGVNYIFRPVLLALDGFGRSFELLVMEVPIGTDDNKHMRTQIFSSQETNWRDVRLAHLPLGYLYMNSIDVAPVVIGRTVYWLCHVIPASATTTTRSATIAIFILQVDTACATTVKLPQECLSGRESCHDLDKGLILATAADGTKLGVVVGEGLVISMWTLTPEEGYNRWSRQVVIRRQEIDKQLDAAITGVVGAYGRIFFDRFGERSGTVIFWIERLGLLQLNLGTKKAHVLRSCRHNEFVYSVQANLHEIDLPSLLEAMKPF
ncbi:hypothetical protein ACP70R_024402 [Stipagrostis hirtigluma subsp. patula]